MAYQTYSILIADGEFSAWVEVLAVSVEAAKADIAAAYGDVQVIQWGCK